MTNYEIGMERATTGVAWLGLTSIAWMDFLRTASEISALLLPIISVLFLLWQWIRKARREQLEQAFDAKTKETPE